MLLDIFVNYKESMSESLNSMKTFSYSSLSETFESIDRESLGQIEDRIACEMKEPELTIEQKHYRNKRSLYRQHLLERRWNLLFKEFEFNDENARRLKDFNQKMKDACCGMYNEALGVYDGLCQSHPDFRNRIELEARLYLKWTGLGRDDRTKLVWEALTGDDSYYSNDGVCSIMFGPHHEMDNLDYLFWLDGKMDDDNWNELLPPVWSADMHLIYGFHNLFDNANFALQDIFQANGFRWEINISIDSDCYCSQ
jgi:hypothetical protein